MKTTLDLPDELVHAVEARAAEENRRPEQVITDLLERGLGQGHSRPGEIRRRLQLPLVECAHEARPGEEMTPDRVASLLLEEEAGRHRELLR